ncbi:hypothetical protein [Streptomyces pinistramenti]|uniref:hypothetical protein n=1 Tax=Streptomyces pinistramenti TaxID=2884812 RepID=UPI001D077593|nr:hypothetical protein [Streptomyces pinistramenti]MCB5911305.1 hypothetical protein [Streptomyces pinistramenti]
MTARRPLLTAAAAGSVLFALWFVPSANAIVESPGGTASGAHTSSAAGATPEDGDGQNSPTTLSGGMPRNGNGARPEGAAPHSLADTGSPDTTPYVIGGAAGLALGAGLVSYSVRRTRDDSA